MRKIKDISVPGNIVRSRWNKLNNNEHVVRFEGYGMIPEDVLFG